MSWKAHARRVYEEAVVSDSLRRLAGRLNVAELPVSADELRTLAKRCRESFRNPEKQRQRLASYQAHLAASYGAALVARITAALEEINNEIGYEEK